MISPIFSRTGHVRCAIVLGCCLAMFCALPLNAGTAHALFSTEVRSEVVHSVKTFPVGLSVESNGTEQRSTQIDREQLTVSVTYSDGSSRALSSAEYELAPSEMPDGFKGDFVSHAIYREDGHELSADLVLEVNGAYGAQYQDTLVFGRGIPAATYQGKTLTSTTWEIEENGCAPRWSKQEIAAVADIDRVRPSSIGGWFDGMTNVRAIALEQMDTSGLTSLASAFSGDSSVTDIDLTGWDTSNVTNMAATFKGCTQLTNIAGLSGFETGSVTSMAETFRYLNNMSDFSGVYEWDTSNVTSMMGIFEDCISMSSLDLKQWDVSKVQSFFMAFDMYPAGNKQSTTYDLTGWNTSSATDMGCMFSGSTKLVSLGNIGTWKTQNVRTMNNMFQNDAALTYVGDLGGWDVRSCTTFLNMFQNCSALTSIGNVSNWKTNNCTDMHQVFQRCAKLTNVNCKSWDVSKVTDHDNFSTGAPGVTTPTWVR